MAWLGAGVLLLLTLFFNVCYLYGCGDGLSPWADSYSEAGSLRAAERFANEGFFQNCGLSDLTYGGRYPGVGITGPSGSDPNDPIYHGYPPGPDWISGVQMRFLGPEHPWRLRIFPTAVGMAAASIFLLALIKAMGAGRALFVYLACVLTPMFTNMTHGLHYQGLAFSLLLVQVAMLLVIFARPRPLGVGWLLLSFVLGFLQGWLSFDYCFVVTFAAIPIALLIAPQWDRSVTRTVLLLVMASGLGFCIAHGLHFLQSAFYFGSIRAALEEYAFRARKTYGVGEAFENQSTGLMILHGLIQYARSYLRWSHLFSPISIIVMEATLAAVVLSRASFTVGRRFRLEATFSHGPRVLAGIGSALVIGLLWLFGKPFHAAIHLTFVGRHLFLFYLACSMVLAHTSLRTTWKRARPKRRRQEAARSHRSQALLGASRDVSD
jgi:hypothetical protein